MTITPSENIKKEVDKKISDVIRNRIILQKKRFHANDNISDFINPGELELLQNQLFPHADYM